MTATSERLLRRTRSGNCSSAFVTHFDGDWRETYFRPPGASSGWALLADFTGYEEYFNDRNPEVHHGGDSVGMLVSDGQGCKSAVILRPTAFAASETGIGQRGKRPRHNTHRARGWRVRSRAARACSVA